MIHPNRTLPAIVSITALLTALHSGCGAQPPQVAPAPAAPARAAGHASVKLVPGSPTVEPGGTMDLGVTFTIDPGWHLYWNGRNDTGSPPTVTLTLPPGVEAGEVLWPAPTRHVMPGDILDHIYEHELMLIVPLKIGTAVRAGDDIVIEASCTWLVCERVCLPGEGKASTRVRIARPGEATPASPSGAIAAARAKLPRPLDASAGISITYSGTVGAEGILVTGGDDVTAVEFYPGNDCIALASPIPTTRADGKTLHLKPEDPDILSKEPLRGVLGVWKKGRTDPAYYSVDHGPRR